MKEIKVIPALGADDAPKKKAKEEVVSVEMTAKQSEDYAKYVLAEEKKLTDAEEAAQPTEVNLRYEHTRNGTKYGPGRIVCRADLAASLYCADEAAYRNRISENDGGKHLIEMSLGGGIKKVTRNVASL